MKINTKLYRKSRLYRSMFYFELQDREYRRSNMRFRRIYYKFLNLAMEQAKDDYREALENKDYTAALQAQEEYLYYAKSLRNKLIDMLY